VRFLKFTATLQSDGPDPASPVFEMATRYDSMIELKKPQQQSLDKGAGNSRKVVFSNSKAVESVPSKPKPQKIGSTYSTAFVQSELSKGVAALSIIEDKENINQNSANTSYNVAKKQKTLFYPIRHLRDGSVSKESLLGKFRNNAANTHGYTEYDYIETCLEWMYTSGGDIAEIYESFHIFNVNYDYVKLVWDYMGSFGPRPKSIGYSKESCWKGREGERTSYITSPPYAFSKEDITSLLDGWALSIEITSDVSDICQQLGCNLHKVGPHVVHIQLQTLKNNPPLLIDQDKVDKSKLLTPGKYHTHPGFLLHCFGLTTNELGDESDIISLICNTRKEFVEAMNRGPSSKLCLICGV